jgi:hypothetical protein
VSIRERGGHDSLVKNIVTRQLPITYSPGRPSGLCTNEVGRPRSPTVSGAEEATGFRTHG